MSFAILCSSSESPTNLSRVNNYAYLSVKDRATGEVKRVAISEREGFPYPYETGKNTSYNWDSSFYDKDKQAFYAVLTQNEYADLAGEDYTQTESTSTFYRLDINDFDANDFTLTPDDVLSINISAPPSDNTYIADALKIGAIIYYARRQLGIWALFQNGFAFNFITREQMNNQGIDYVHGMWLFSDNNTVLVSGFDLDGNEFLRLTTISFFNFSDTGYINGNITNIVANSGGYKIEGDRVIFFNAKVNGVEDSWIYDLETENLMQSDEEHSTGLNRESFQDGASDI